MRHVLTHVFSPDVFRSYRVEPGKDSKGIMPHADESLPQLEDPEIQMRPSPATAINMGNRNPVC